MAAAFSCMCVITLNGDDSFICHGEDLFGLYKNSCLSKWPEFEAPCMLLPCIELLYSNIP